jgi:YVTN family beta-propeller protein
MAWYVAWACVDNANGRPRHHLVVRIDPSTNEVVATIPVFEAGDIAASDGAVWVTSRLDNAEGALVRIDPSTNQVVASVPVGMNPSNVALGDGAVWVTLNRTSAGFRPSGEVIRIDPMTNEVVARITIGGGWPSDVVVDERSVWIYGHSDYTTAEGWEGSSLWQIDPATNELVGVTLDDGGFLGDGGALPDNVAVGDGAVWVADDRGRGLRIDPTTGGVTRFDVDGGFAWPFLVEDGRVWFGRDEIRVLDGTGLEVVHVVEGEIEAVDAAFDPSTSTLWIANYKETIARIDRG